VTAFIPDSSIFSWGRVERLEHRAARPSYRDEIAPLIGEARQRGLPLLPIGLGRSYGDSGLNGGGAVIGMTGLDRLIGFDPATGVLEAEAGISLGQILDYAVPRGFFLPVTPGTKFVTLGGAIANDVHGKNHHSAGTLGRWVREIELLRTDGAVHMLRPEDNTGLFAATIGGLGLTGIITRAKLKLVPIESSLMDTRTIPFGRLSEFFTIARQNVGTHSYNVSWIDCLASGDALGRGIYTIADHARAGGLDRKGKSSGPKVPFDFPALALNRLSVAAFNALVYTNGRLKAGARRVPYGPYFYPLDSIGQWNRIYGKRGMYQYQSVVPPGVAESATAEMLRAISRAGQGSFLVVLKTFGDLSSPGLLSFPRAGTTLALDFPNRGASTLALLDRLDAIVREAGGRLYPAKDGRISGAMFRSGQPEFDRFAAHVDPGLSSTFWRRVQG
jgi:FAD/FMN-containing dehydrogenase